MINDRKLIEMVNTQQQQIEALSKKVDTLADILLHTLCTDHMYITAVSPSYILKCEGKSYGPFRSWDDAKRVANEFMRDRPWDIVFDLDIF